MKCLWSRLATAPTLKLLLAILLVVVSLPLPASAESGEKQPSLSKEDQKIWDRGEIDDTSYIAGGVLGTFFGFGLGHAVQGRYLERGWIFTVGEFVLGMVAVTRMMGSCERTDGRRDTCTIDGLATASVIGAVGLRVWEIIDLWTVVPQHNRRYRALRDRKVGLFISPQLQRPMTVGLAYRF